MPKRVLVTGGAGFIGSFLVDKLLGRGHTVRIFDNLTTQVHPGGNPPSYLNPGAEFVKGDVLSRSKLVRAIKDIDVIFHFAAAVGVGQSQYQVSHYVETNVGGTAMLFDILVNETHNVEHVFVAASKSSYGEGLYLHPTLGKVRPPLRREEDVVGNRWEPRLPDYPDDPLTPLPTDEDQHLNCTNIYSLTKRDQEEIAMMLGRLYRLPVTCFRFFNVYGPRQSLSNPYTGVTAIFMGLLKNGRAPVIFEDGKQDLDFISVHDVVAACLLAMDKPERSAYQVFNLGTGVPTPVLEVARMLARIYGKEIEPEVTNTFRKGDVRHCYADITRIRQELGFRPRVTLEEGLRELVEWSETADAQDNFDKARAELVNRGLL